MAWSTPPTFTDGSVLTAAQMNILRDDLNETAPAKFTASGQFLVSTGANAGAARTPNADSVAAVETTASTSYVDIASAGPALTVSTGLKVFVAVHARLVNDTGGAHSHAGWAVSSATTLAASDALSAGYESSNASDNIRCSGAWVYTGLNAGSNVITMKYRVSAGIGSFGERRLSVIPF